MSYGTSVELTIDRTATVCEQRDRLINELARLEPAVKHERETVGRTPEWQAMYTRAQDIRDTIRTLNRALRRIEFASEATMWREIVRAAKEHLSPDTFATLEHIASERVKDGLAKDAPPHRQSVKSRSHVDA